MNIYFNKALFSNCRIWIEKADRPCNQVDMDFTFRKRATKNGIDNTSMPFFMIMRLIPLMDLFLNKVS